MNTFVDNWDLMHAVTARFPLDDFQDPTNPSIVYSAELLWWRSGLPGDHQYDQYMGFGKTLLRKAKKDLGEVEITSQDIAGIERIYAGLLQDQVKALSVFNAHHVNPARNPLDLKDLTWFITKVERTGRGQKNLGMIGRMTGNETKGMQFELAPSVDPALHQPLTRFFTAQIAQRI